MPIHPTALIDPKAEIDPKVEVGPYAYIGPEVRLAKGVRIGHAATLEGPLIIGPQTQVWPHAVVGAAPQDLKYAGETSRLEIGARCKIREFASLHRGTAGGGMVTRIGDDVLIMNGAHVGHDCQVGNHCIIAANCALGGHVVLEDHAIIGGLTGVHQWVRVGAHAMVGAGLLVSRDVPPYAVVKGHDETLVGVNITGLKRRGFERKSIQAIQAAMKTLFLARSNVPLAQAIVEVQTTLGQDPAVRALLNFIEEPGPGSKPRGFVAPAPPTS